MASLYQIAAEIEHLIAASEDGEIDADRLDALDMDLRVKVDNICRAIRTLDAEALAFGAEAARLTALQRAAAGRAAWLKTYVQTRLTGLGIAKLDTELFKVAIQKNSRPSIRLEDGAEIPESFARVVVEFDGGKAYESWKAGQEMPAGVVVEHGSHLRIR